VNFGDISHIRQNQPVLKGQQDEETHYQAYWSLQQSADLIEHGLKRALDIKKTQLHNSHLSKFQHGNEVSKPVCLWHGFLFFFAQHFFLCPTYLPNQLQTSPESQT